MLCLALPSAQNKLIFLHSQNCIYLCETDSVQIIRQITSVGICLYCGLHSHLGTPFVLISSWSHDPIALNALCLSRSTCAAAVEFSHLPPHLPPLHTVVIAQGHLL